MAKYVLITPLFSYKAGTILDTVQGIDFALIDRAGGIYVATPNEICENAALNAADMYRKGIPEHVITAMMVANYVKSLQVFPLGRVDLDVSGQGEYKPSRLAISANQLDCIGALTGDKSIVLNLGDGESRVLANKSTGPYLMSFNLPQDAQSVYVTPGQRKQVRAEAGKLYAVDEESILAKLPISLLGGVGTTDAPILKLPPQTTLTRLLVRGNVAPVGGTVTFQAGLTSGGAELLASASAPNPGILVGETSGWGNSMANGQSYDGGNAAFLVYLRLVRSAQITDGSFTVYAMGSRTP